MNTPVSPELDRLLLEKNIPMPVNPTIADVVMWLYEKYEIWISVQPNEPYVDDDWCFTIFKNLKNNISLEGYNSPTEAYEAAIEYALKKSI